MRRQKLGGEGGLKLMRKMTLSPMDAVVANMINVTKKKAEITKKGLQNIGDAALMYLDQQNR